VAGVGQTLGIVAVIAAFGAVMAGLAYFGSRIRRRGRGRGAEAFMGPFEDMWHPAAHRARLQVETVEERMVPMPSAGDKPATGA
jgi:hypothetical protein